jgi:hypothetical protein
VNAAERLLACKSALRDAEAHEKRATIAYENAVDKDAAWTAIVDARNARARARTDLEIATAAAKREEFDAGAARRKELLAELAEETGIVNRAWPVLLDRAKQIANHALAIAELTNEIDAYVEVAQVAAARAKDIAAELGTYANLENGLATIPLVKLIVRAHLMNAPRELAQWVATGRVHWQDQRSALFRRARRLIGDNADFSAEEQDAIRMGDVARPGEGSDEWRRSFEEITTHRLESLGFS